MNVERLKLMSTMLGEISSGTWVGAPDVGQKINGFDLQCWAMQTGYCGFSACAVGHATYDARFHELGLTASAELRPIFEEDKRIYKDWNAVQHFFGLDILTASVLFNDYFYYDEWSPAVRPRNKSITASQVKARVDELLVIGANAIKAKYPGQGEEDSRTAYFKSLMQNSEHISAIVKSPS